MIITRHAIQRMCQRMQGKLHGPNLRRRVEEALEHGLRLADASGRVRWYLKARMRPGVEAIIHNGYCFIFKGGALVTVYRVQGVVRRLAARQQRRKQREAQERCRGRPRGGQAGNGGGGDLRPDR